MQNNSKLNSSRVFW